MIDAAIARWGAQGAIASSDAELQAGRRAAGMSATLRGQLSGLQDHTGAWQDAVTYPTSDHPLPERLAALAHMIDEDLPLKVVALDANGGYDTHENEAATLSENLGVPVRLAGRVPGRPRGARHRRPRARARLERVRRRPAANGSGTDHGAGGASLLMGTQASGRMVGEFPGLGTLDDNDNLRHTVDFRGVYRGLTEQWLGVSADGIVPDAGRFAAPQPLR